MRRSATPEYKLTMGPVGFPSSDHPNRYGSQWRATLPNGWGPPCWHRKPEVAIDCLERRISEVMRP